MRDRVREMVAESIGLDHLPEWYDLEADDRWNSLAKVIVVSRMVDELGIDVPLDVLVNVTSLDDMLALLGDDEDGSR